MEREQGNFFVDHYEAFLTIWHFVVLAIFIAIMHLPVAFKVVAWIVAGTFLGWMFRLRGRNARPCAEDFSGDAMEGFDPPEHGS